MAEDAAVQADAETHVIMLVKTGAEGDVQWFEYRPDFFGEITRIEWDKDTMSVALPADTAEHLIRHKYARPMTPQELEEYTAPPPPTPKVGEEKKPRKRKETDNDQG